ncbi:hypothetical protein WFP14_08550 [Yersinia proxima]|uniref:Uncharacterized protein n=1 Tax=Yersinia proxima TaxID=2890316 RepID=A0ABW9EXV4_9GAMM
MLSKEPVRIRHDWNVAVVGYCDFCSHSKMTVPHADGGRICASCCDSEFLSSWQNYARSLATEVLSLREQLAELKALEPVAWQSVSTSSCNRMVTLHKEMAKDWERKGFAVMPLFTAAKPAEIPRHIFSMLVNELRDVPAIGCKRQLIISVLNRHGVIPESVQLDPPANK